MNRIYLDHASTSFPKAPGVAQAMMDYLTLNGANVNRGCYSSAYSAEEVIYETRQLLAQLFHFPKCKNVIFTPNITTSLNFILKGLLKPGDHILVSAMEHNAVMRPVVQLTSHGITFDRIPCREDGSMIPEQVEPLIRPNTRAIVTLHSSNVCGTCMPLAELGEICRKHYLFFIVDTAQTAGILPVDMEKFHIDALAFTGHKGLRGPQGTGGFLVTQEIAELMEPLVLEPTPLHLNFQMNGRLQKILKPAKATQNQLLQKLPKRTQAKLNSRPTASRAEPPLSGSTTPKSRSTWTAAPLTSLPTYSPVKIPLPCALPAPFATL